VDRAFTTQSPQGTVRTVYIKQNNMQRTTYILLGEVCIIENFQHEETLPFLHLLILGGRDNLSEIKNYKPWNIDQEKKIWKDQ